MSKTKLKKISRLEKEYQELLRKREEAKEEAFKSIGEMVYKNWNIEELEDYDLLEKFIKEKSKEFNSMSENKNELDTFIPDDENKSEEENNSNEVDNENERLEEN